MARILLFFGAVVLSFNCFALKKVGPLRMELVLEQDGIVAGAEFWVGWRIIRENGWHTYWKHPGDVGVPPSIEWNLPQGFIAGEMLYALPEKVKMANIRANGNYGETIFLVKMKAPKNLKLGDIVDLKAKASWLTCSQQCLPGFTDLSVGVEVVDSAEIVPVWNQRFEQFKQNIPENLGSSWKISAKKDNNFVYVSFVLTEGMDTEKSRPVFFCSNRLVKSDGNQFLTRKKNSFTLRMDLSEWANKGEKYLSGLIYRKNGWGVASSYAKVHVPFSSSN